MLIIVIKWVQLKQDYYLIRKEVIVIPRKVKPDGKSHKIGDILRNSITNTSEEIFFNKYKSNV